MKSVNRTTKFSPLLQGRKLPCKFTRILGDNPTGDNSTGYNPLPKIPLEVTPPPHRLGVLTLTDPRREVLTLIPTNPRGGELSEN